MKTRTRTRTWLPLGGMAGAVLWAGHLLVNLGKWVPGFLRFSDFQILDTGKEIGISVNTASPSGKSILIPER